MLISIRHIKEDIDSYLVLKFYARNWGINEEIRMEDKDLAGLITLLAIKDRHFKEVSLIEIDTDEKVEKEGGGQNKYGI